MKIFTLNKTHQSYDYEHWQHWGESSVLNYYISEELAKTAMNDLIEKEDYSDSNKVWDSKLGDTRNVINIMTGTHSNAEFNDVNLYFIDSINVITE